MSVGNPLHLPHNRPYPHPPLPLQTAASNLYFYHSNPQVLLLRILFPRRVFTLTTSHECHQSTINPELDVSSTTVTLFEELPNTPVPVQIAQGNGFDLPAANWFLVADVVKDREELAQLTTKNSLAAQMFSLERPRIRLLASGLAAMAAISPAEWDSRKAQLAAAEPRIANDDRFEVRLEHHILQGGLQRLAMWDAEVRAAVNLLAPEKREWADMFKNVEKFLDEVGYEKYRNGWEQALS